MLNLHNLTEEVIEKKKKVQLSHRVDSRLSNIHFNLARVIPIQTTGVKWFSRQEKKKEAFAGIRTPSKKKKKSPSKFPSIYPRFHQVGDILRLRVASIFLDGIPLFFGLRGRSMTQTNHMYEVVTQEKKKKVGK